MKLRNSRVLREIRLGCVASCVKLNLGDSRVVELCGNAGFSAAWLCMEHVPNDWRIVEEAVRAAKIYDMDLIVRVARGSYSDYVKPFECDAAGIMVPHVETAEEARRIVESCRFMPLGKRALDGGNVDGAFCQASLEEYLEHSNRERFIILQIESPEALENAEEIAQVPGFDFLLFGPGDFAHRIGKPGQYTCPEVEAARGRVEAAAKNAGKTCMAVGVPPDPETLARRGYSLANLGSDVVGLGAYLNALCASLQRPGAASRGDSPYSVSHALAES